MILFTLWFLNFALAAAIVVALFQKRRHKREEEKQGDRSMREGTKSKEVRSG